MKRVTDYFATVPSKKPANARTISTPLTTKAGPPESNAVSAATPLTPRSSQSPSKPFKWDKDAWVAQLSPENRELLDLEIKTMDESWLAVLYKELTKPYFLSLKRFLTERRRNAQVFPPENDVYSWSRLTPLHNVKVLVLGQDPYHGINQAHGLAFSVKPPTRTPPSLLNIYKELRSCFPDDFEIPKHGFLEKWAQQGVLMLNACLTVDAHNANSHANKGWEQFTEQVVRAALNANDHVVIMAWGSPAAKRVDRVRPGSQHLVLRSVHPSPLSAARGWFGSAHFKKGNEWLEKMHREPVNWRL